MIVLCLGIQREDIIEHANGKCHVLTTRMREEDMFEHLLPSVIYKILSIILKTIV